MDVQYDLFENNWDRIFSKRDDLTYNKVEVDWDKAAKYSITVDDSKDMLREVTYDGMWQHSCTVEMSVVWIGKDETCNYCGAWEEDES